MSRRLNQMNGDFLLQLRKPLRSEAGSLVRGHIHANRSELKRKVDILFNERNYRLNMLQRSQDAVYCTMLRAHKQKKLIQQMEYKKQQDQLRTQSIKSLASKTEEYQHEEEPNDSELQVQPQNEAQSDSIAPNEAVGDNTEESPLMTITQRAKVLEVSRGTPKKPSVHTRENSIIIEGNVKKFPKIDLALFTLKDSSSPTPPSPVLSTSRHLEEAPPTRAMSHPEPLSQIEMNRQKHREIGRRRKEILDKEPLNIFTKDGQGNVVPSILPFRRRRFQAPTLREIHFRQKMLRAQIEAKVDQELKIERFFHKLDDDGAQMKKWAVRQREPPKIQGPQKEKFKAEVTVSLNEMMRAFGQGQRIPENVDPKSFEALQYCKYLRSYTPKDRIQRRRASKG
ncbi:hypothetical protein CAPTEDRAFT_184969 [Capitella teleta]|uniref:Uncharacterized protein n=1 Tax=Capitella teleta TaxID=283909 RepID=R7UNJ3_CAPTE|nr:hypothetical protein CAPTEDRAFT_184969 [Capitella teleta]|eukprot:ELU04966.1 hypothetical protein CAPTEDRAFT_184969 [Capitella teleta]